MSGTPTPPRAGEDKRLEFHIHYRCSCRCTFCSERHRMDVFRTHPISLREASSVLLRMAERGYGHVNLTGGEPTLFPRFPQLAALAKKLGYRVYIATNGVRLQQESFARETLPYLDELSLSLHGHTPALHDRLTGIPGSHAALMATLGHARTLKPDLARYMNTVVTRENPGAVVELVRFAREAGVRQYLVSALAPEGSGLDRYAELHLPLAAWRELAPRVAEAARREGVLARFFALPLCVLGDAVPLANDFYYDPRATVERIFLPDGSPSLVTVYSQHPFRGRVKPPVCAGCRYAGVCGGIFQTHLEQVGDRDLVPFK